MLKKFQSIYIVLYNCKVEISVSIKHTVSIKRTNWKFFEMPLLNVQYDLIFKTIIN